MSALLRFLPALGVALVALSFAAFALSRFEDGASQEAAIPVPNYMITGQPLKQAAYAHAKAMLEQANPADGDAQIAAAEAAFHAGASSSQVTERLVAGLQSSPASSRGWLLLSEVLAANKDHAGATAALSQSLLLGSFEYWLAERRANDAAQQWTTLDPDTRALALRQTQLLWDEPTLRHAIRPLLSSTQGVELLNAAFAQRRDDLRLLNRWVSANRRRTQDQ